MAAKKRTPSKSASSSKGDAPESGEIVVLAERELEDGETIRVVSDGVRVWKEAPDDTGMGPRP